MYVQYTRTVHSSCASGHGKLDTPSSAAAPSAGAAKKKFDLYGKDTPDVAPSARATFQQLDESHPEYSKIKRRVQVLLSFGKYE